MFCAIVSVLLVGVIAWMFLNPAQRTCVDPLETLNQGLASNDEQVKYKASISFAKNLKAACHTNPVAVEFADEVISACTSRNRELVSQALIALCLETGREVDELECLLLAWK